MRLRVFGKICFSTFLVITLLVPNALPFSAKYAEAQSTGSGGSSVSGSAGASLGTGFNAGGLIASAISCSGVIDKLASALSGLLSVTEVPVGDAALRTKENCMDAMVHQLVVLILDKITLSTVDWINGGFKNSEGGSSPLWLQKPDEFFGDIARSEINRVTGWYGCTNGSLGCTTNYPFGQLVMGSIISTVQSQLAANVQFSLNQVLAHGTYEEYKFDFNVGGWAGYTAFLEPNNNPFGNSLLVNRELGRRIGGTSMSVSQNFKTQLEQSGGFLNQRKCVMTETGDSNDEYSAGTSVFLDPASYQTLYGADVLPADIYLGLPVDVQVELDGTNSDQAELELYNYFVNRSICRQWQTTTPGNVISNKLTAALNISDNKLIQADEVSESLGLIFDALINQLASKGLEELSSFAIGGGDTGGSSNSVLLAQVNGQQPGQITNGQTPPPAGDAITGTGYSNEPLLLVQQQYIPLAQQAVVVLDTLVKKTHALDYCVPGPNPNWLDDAQDNLQSALQSVAPFASSDPDPADAEVANEDYYAAAINTLTGINIVHSPNMHNHTQFTAFMNNLFAKYSAKMQDTADIGYNRFLAPPNTRIFLQNLFADVETYQTSYNNLSDYLANITSYMPTLISIDTTINNLIAANNGVLNQSDPAVQAQLSLFNSISDHFATEAQLTQLQTSYVLFQNKETTLNSHINSCLNETVNQAYNFPNKRVQYPVPISPSYGQNQTPAIPTNMPAFDGSFLPGVDFDDSTNGGNIDASFGGVGIVGTEPLGIFEAVLQSIY